MLHPAPTNAVDPLLARGVLEEVRDATATKPAHIVMSFYNTSYKLRLLASDETIVAMRPRAGKRVLGTIRVGARKIADCKTGGKFVEPVFGAPQHIQGKVIAHHNDAIVVNAGMPIHVTPTHPNQNAQTFQVGSFMTFDATEGAVFEPSDG